MSLDKMLEIIIDDLRKFQVINHHFMDKKLD